MDIKLKKSKAAVSAICLLLSTAVFLGTVVMGVTVAVNYPDVRSRLDDMNRTDYQNTASFRSVMSSYLSSILRSIRQEEKMKDEDEYAQEQAKNNGYDSVDEFIRDKGYETVEEWIKNEREDTKFADLNEHDTAKNLLYQAGTAEYPAKYTNDTAENNLYKDSLPTGYNFRLIFDGKKVTAEKDGKQVNIYGDGFYKSNENMWYVPGYENLPFDADPDYRVCLVARTLPAEPVNGVSQLYDITRQNNRIKIIFYIWAGAFAMALLMMFPTFGWRKHRRLMSQQLGLLSGKVFFEIKLLCSILLFILDITFTFEIGAHLDVILFIAVPSLFCWYIVFNDMRWNPKFWENNMVNYLKAKDKEKERMLPVQKRLTARLARLYKRELLIVLIGGFLSVITGPGALLLGPVTLAVMWYYAHNYKQEYAFVTGDLGRLIDQIAAVKEGDMTPPLVLPIDADMYGAAENLNMIREGVENAVDERLKSERMKIELITNVSHDIKTPLTSIISYVELLKQEEDLPEYIKDYVRILDEKSIRLKNMVQDIFEVSKASSGNMEMNMEQLDLGKLLRQTLADMAEQVEASPLIFKVEIPSEPVYINADGKRLYRVFQNLINNALLYSMEGTRVFITLNRHEDIAAAMIKNISKYEMNNPEELTERFVRGDSSRSTSGSGLGLSIAKSFTEACGGKFSIWLDADLFTACVQFPMLENIVPPQQGDDDTEVSPNVEEEATEEELPKDRNETDSSEDNLFSDEPNSEQDVNEE